MLRSKKENCALKPKERNAPHRLCRKPGKKCRSCESREKKLAVLQEALKEVLDQNDILRSRVVELEALISESEDRMKEGQALPSSN